MKVRTKLIMPLDRMIGRLRTGNHRLRRSMGFHGTVDLSQPQIGKLRMGAR